MLRIAMIGNGSMLKSCIEIAQRHAVAGLALVLLKAQADGWHRLVEALCRKRGIRCIAYERIDHALVGTAIAECRADLLVSVHNPDILPAAIFERAPLAINFHPAPLPRYAGLNPFSWALLAGETVYGVTWHVLAGRIDAGDIVAQRAFPIESSWGVSELRSAASAAGCALLDAILPPIAAGETRFQPQDLRQRSYFSGAMKPFGGNFPFTAPAPVLDNLRRATAYFPGPNDFCRPRVMVQETSFELVRFRLDQRPSDAAPGTIVRIDESGIAFAAGGITITADYVRAADGSQRHAAEFAIMARLAAGARAEIDRQGYTPNGLPEKQKPDAVCPSGTRQEASARAAPSR